MVSDRYRASTVLPDREWAAYGTCLRRDPALFEIDNLNDPNADRAVAVCWSECPVRAACELWGGEDRYAEGVRGGYIWRRGNRLTGATCVTCGRRFELRGRRTRCDPCYDLGAELSTDAVRAGKAAYRDGDRSPHAVLCFHEAHRRRNWSLKEVQCGTVGGYERHRVRDTTVCTRCLVAYGESLAEATP